jgi:hypothetical protein
MRTRTLSAISALLLPFLLPAFSPTISNAQRRRPARASAPTLIFKVFKTESGGYMEPIVALDRGQYKDPFDVEPDDEKFNSLYFRPGQSYRLLYGGAGGAGTAKVEKPTERGCSQWGAADVSLQSSINIERTVATNSNSLGRKPATRRAPTEAERKRALTIARKVFRQNRVAASLLQKVEIEKLLATDLDGDGHLELIGNFKIGPNPEDGIPTPDHTLLLLLEPQRQNYRIGLARYYHIKVKNMQEAGPHSDDYLEQLDLDGDGTDEVIIETHYWEGWNYSIFKKRRGHWRRIYQGAGGGC